MRISPRDKLILVAVGIAVVAVIAGLLLIYPQVQTIATIDKQIQQAEKEVDEANALLLQRQDMKDRAAQTDVAYLRLANSVPETPELPSLIIELQDVALQSGVSFEGLRPGEPITNTSSQSSSGGGTQATAASTAQPAAAGEYVVIPMDVSISGSWSDTIDFMNRIQRMTRAIRIVEYNTSSNTGGTAQTDQTSSATSELTNMKLEAYTVPTAASSTGITPGTTGPVPTSNQ
jgi:Tfp pilus assembly protein PilO